MVDDCPTVGLMSYVTGFILKLHIGSYEIIDVKISNHYTHLLHANEIYTKGRLFHHV